jgi:dTDP-4-dehydrorhamnose reductase
LNSNTQTILITGANGQLGTSLGRIADRYPQYYFLFTTKDELPIDDPLAVDNYFAKHQIDICINCAAYTAVDKAESEKEKAFAVNAAGVANIAAACKKHQTILIHISTDYVFDGTATRPYRETDKVNPANTYGASKLKGEELALQNNPQTIIIRASWLYSAHGHNFVRTMLKLMSERESINVVNDQSGCPTYTTDLADAIMQMIVQLPTAKCHLPAIFNYSNSGITTWFDFANAIKEFTGSACIVQPIPTAQYPAPAKRPHYSVLDTTKIREVFHIHIPEWNDSLQNCLKALR